MWTRWLFVVNGTVDEEAEVEPTQRIHTGTPTPIKWNKNGKKKIEFNNRELKQNSSLCEQKLTFFESPLIISVLLKNSEITSRMQTYFHRLMVWNFVHYFWWVNIIEASTVCLYTKTLLQQNCRTRPVQLNTISVIKCLNILVYNLL